MKIKDQSHCRIFLDTDKWGQKENTEKDTLTVVFSGEWEKETGEIFQTDEICTIRMWVTIPGLGECVMAEKKVSGIDGEFTLEMEYPCEEELRFWDEFDPFLYEADIRLEARCGEIWFSDFRLKETFGICQFCMIGTQFQVNGQTVFLRCSAGKEELASGFSKEQWMDLLKSVKKRGLNAIQISEMLLSHDLLSAADQIGIYVKIACDRTADGIDALVIQKKMEMLIAEYANHPSFVLISEKNKGGKCLHDQQIYNGEWREFAVRDRKDYSDAPDTRSNHLEDIQNHDYPTLVTFVGEWRHKPDHITESMEYLSAICCREEMEAAMRTPGFGGFVLHEDAEVLKLPVRLMREFCGAVVPMLQMKKYVWSSDEQFQAGLVIANYSNERLIKRITVSAVDENGSRYMVTSNKIRINRGGLIAAGKVTIPLNKFAPGQRIELEISIDETEYQNHYSIWLFSDDISVKIPDHIHVSRKYDERTKRLLEEGRTVVLIPKLNTIKSPYSGWFSPLASVVCRDHSDIISGGICVNMKNPALKGFPTEEVGDFQWWNLIHTSIPVFLPGFDQEGAIVQMETGREEGKGLLIFEAKAGKGKILFSAIDLLIQLDRPEARQLYQCLLKYASSEEFAPTKEVILENILQSAGES